MMDSEDRLEAKAKRFKDQVLLVEWYEDEFHRAEEHSLSKRADQLEAELTVEYDILDKLIHVASDELLDLMKQQGYYGSRERQIQKKS